MWSVQTVFSGGSCHCITVTQLSTCCHDNIIFLNRRIDTGSSSSSIHLSLSPEAYQVAPGSWCYGAKARPWCEMAELEGVSLSRASLCYTRKMLIQLSLSFTLLITVAFVNICLMVLYLCDGFGSSSESHLC